MSDSKGQSRPNVHRERGPAQAGPSRAREVRSAAKTADRSDGSAGLEEVKREKRIGARFERLDFVNLTDRPVVGVNFQLYTDSNPQGSSYTLVDSINDGDKIPPYGTRGMVLQATNDTKDVVRVTAEAWIEPASGPDIHLQYDHRVTHSSDSDIIGAVLGAFLVSAYPPPYRPFGLFLWKDSTGQGFEI